MSEIVNNLSRRDVYFTMGTKLQELDELIFGTLSSMRRARELRNYEGMPLKETFFIWVGDSEQWTDNTVELATTTRPTRGAKFRDKAMIGRQIDKIRLM